MPGRLSSFSRTSLVLVTNKAPLSNESLLLSRDAPPDHIDGRNDPFVVHAYAYILVKRIAHDHFHFHSSGGILRNTIDFNFRNL